MMIFLIGEGDDGDSGGDDDDELYFYCIIIDYSCYKSVVEGIFICRRNGDMISNAK